MAIFSRNFMILHIQGQEGHMEIMELDHTDRDHRSDDSGRQSAAQESKLYTSCHDTYSGAGRFFVHVWYDDRYDQLRCFVA